MNNFCVVFITTPKGRQSQKITREIIQKRLAACVNVVPGIRSVYRWKGKVESAGESLLIVKTRQSLVHDLIKLMKKVHPYSVPEVIALPIKAGNQPYLAWLLKETR